MFDRALQREFPDDDDDHDTNQGTDAGSFNSIVAKQQAVLETVARVEHKKNESKDEKSFQFHDVFNLDNENQAEDMPTLIDRKDNVFIISNPKSKYPVLQLDWRLISDLVVVIVSATCGGIAFACIGQPVMTGYQLAGSIIGPGGLSFVNEMLQIVRGASILGGLLQTLLFMCLCRITASLCGGKSSEGVFVGAFLSTSSTAVCSDKLGISIELGSLAVGLMISTTDFGLHTLEQPIRNLFAALFLTSIGMLIHVRFPWIHVDILLAAVILVIIVKAIVAATVVKGFGYNKKTSLLVGMSLAQIGEFAFVLLSRASNLHIVEGKLYLLLLATTALSLVITPLLFKLIPAVVHLGALLRWFPPDSPAEVPKGAKVVD